MKVTAKLQAAGNDPVDVVWSKKQDDLGVIICVSQLLEQARGQEPWNPELLSITIEKD